MNKIAALFLFCYFLTCKWLLPDQGIKKDGIVFGCQERYYVAVGVAEALDYLHSGIEEPVVHKDVKSSNILLSDDFEPQVLCGNLKSCAFFLIIIIIF